MYEVNEILLRRKHKVILAEYDFLTAVHTPTSREKAMIISIMKNIESLGFTFDKSVVDYLMTYSAEEIKGFYLELIPQLKVLVGADKTYRRLMYPNFPKQVAEMDDVELMFSALMHYYSYGTMFPKYEKDERMPLCEDTSLTVISVGTTHDLMEIFKNLVGSKTNLSQQDKNDVEKIISEYANYSSYLPDEIPLKENVALVGKCMLEKSPIKSANIICKYYNTATDVLRLITALSNGDISLATPVKFRSLRRCERRVIMDLLAGCGDILEDMYRYRERWIRVGEIIHPGEYNMLSNYSKVTQAFDNIRNGKKPLFDSGKIEEAIKDGNIYTAVNLLKKRPGDFARHLDKLLRDADDKEYVLSSFTEVAPTVSTPVLL